MACSEVPLCVPHAPPRLHLIGHQLLPPVNLHRAVDDAVGGGGLEVANLQDHNLEREGKIETIVCLPQDFHELFGVLPVLGLSDEKLQT